MSIRVPYELNESLFKVCWILLKSYILSNFFTFLLKHFLLKELMASVYVTFLK